MTVDAPSVEASEEMVQECQQLFGKPICALVLTHPHPDHVWGLDALLAKTGQIPFCRKGCREEIKNQGMQMPVNLIEIEGRENIPIGRAMMHLEKVPVQAHSPWDLMLFCSMSRRCLPETSWCLPTKCILRTAFCPAGKKR